MSVFTLINKLAWAADKEPKIVSTEWLRNKLGQTDIRIVDIRNSMQIIGRVTFPEQYTHPHEMRLSDGEVG